MVADEKSPCTLEPGGGGHGGGGGAPPRGELLLLRWSRIPVTWREACSSEVMHGRSGGRHRVAECHHVQLRQPQPSHNLAGPRCHLGLPAAGLRHRLLVGLGWVVWCEACISVITSQEKEKRKDGSSSASSSHVSLNYSTNVSVSISLRLSV